MRPWVPRLIICACLLVVSAAAAQEDPQSWYLQETINEGLAERPEELKLATPRSTLRTFVELADKRRFETAAHVLNLKDLVPEEQQARGAAIARQLHEVLDRRVWIDWSALPSRPDAKVEDGSGRNPQAGQVRRDLEIKLLEVNGRAYEIRIGRYKAGEDADPVWLFTPQTVEDVAPLHAAFGPRAFERFIPWQLQQKFGGLRQWEWIALPVLIGLVLLLGWIVNRAVSWLAGRVTHGFFNHALDRAGIPLALFAMAMAAQVVLDLVVSFSGPVTSVVQPILVLVMACAIGIALLRSVDTILDRVTRRFVGEIDDTRGLEKRELYTSIYALRRVIVLVMVGFAAFYVLSRLNLFESFGITLLASAGVLTVLLGIAGQAVLGNILASLQIALAKPVRIGDSVLFEGEWAYVETIFYTYLRLRTWDERRIVVPVTYFVTRPFENWSVTDARIMKTIKLSLDHAADIEVLRDKFRELAEADEGVIEPDQLSAYVTAHSEDGQDMTFYAMTPDPSTGWQTEMRLREGLLRFIQSEHPDWWPHERVADPAIGPAKVSVAAE